MWASASRVPIAEPPRASGTRSRKPERAALKRRLEDQFGAEVKALQRRLDQAFDEMTAYKFEAVERHGVFDTLVAKGDTWEEVFAELDAKKPAPDQKQKPNGPF